MQLDLFHAHLFVLGNQTELEQVFLNIVKNAVDAMPEGGKIRIHSLQTLSSGENEKVQLTMADTGEGISPHHLSKIFTPFFTTKPIGKGTGLGLSISQRIMEDHGGSLSVESTLGEGTTVLIQLPAFSQTFEETVKQ